MALDGEQARHENAKLNRGIGLVSSTEGTVTHTDSATLKSSLDSLLSRCQCEQSVNGEASPSYLLPAVYYTCFIQLTSKLGA